MSTSRLVAAGPSSRFVALSITAVLACGLAVPAFAAKGASGGKNTSPTGSCSVNPNPVAVGADYTLTGTGLGANALVNVLITDSGGTTSWNLQADSAGTASVVWHSYWSGTSNVKFNESARHGSVTVASCAFQVT